MPLIIQCPKCATTVSAPDEAAGKQGRCTTCGQLILIPTAAAAAPVPLPIAAPAIASRMAPPPPPLQNPPQPLTEEPAPTRARAASAAPKKSGISTRTIVLVLAGIFVAMLLAGGALFTTVYFVARNVQEKVKRANVHLSLLQIRTAQKMYFAKHGAYAGHLNDLLTEKSSELSLATYGYSFTILHSQGEHATGGAKSYLDATGKLRSYAVAAFPATGTGKAYLMDANGVRYSKQLPNSTLPDADPETFDPDETWNRE